jgi:hypothetical protein
MFSSSKRVLLLMAAGCILLQAPTCDTALQVISVGLLGVLTGITYYIARQA